MQKFKELVNTYYLNIIFLIAFLGTAGSLVLSEFFELPPCDLCWYQRILLYPIAIISFLAIIYRDKNVSKYILTMAIAGFFIAAYHYGIQMTGSESLLGSCQVGIPCGEILLDPPPLGFITIPFMSAISFLTIIVALVLKDRFSK